MHVGVFGPVEDVGGGLMVGTKLEIEMADDRSLPCDVALTAELRKGRYEVVALTCTRRPNGPEITSELIRTVPVGAVLRRGALDAYKLFSPGANPVRLRAEGPTDDTLRVVARVYRMAVVVRDDPTRAVASTFDVPRPTASRWVQMARKRRFLGPAEERKAGERKRR